MFEDQYFTIRWRWALIGPVTLMLLALIAFGVHEWQVSRIGDRLLQSARASVMENDAEGAKRSYASYLSLIPEDVAAHEEYANVILSEPRSADRDLTVLRLMDDALRHGAVSQEMRAEMIQAAVRLERYSAASMMLAKMNLDTIRDSRLFACEGVCLMKKGDFAGAKISFRKALEIDDCCTAAWKGMVDLAAADDGLPAALKVADEMASRVSGAEPYAIKAHLLVKADSSVAAGEAFWKASDAAADDFVRAKEFADFIMYNVPPTDDMNLQMVQAAYDSLSRTTQTVDFITSAQLGDLAHRLKQFPVALSHYQKCLELKPGDSFAIGRSVEILANLDRHKEAHALLDTMGNFNSMMLLRQTLRAQLFADKGRYAEASDLLEQVVDATGDADLKQGACFLLVQCLWEQQQHDAATEYAKQLLDDSEGLDECRDLLVECCIRGDRYEEVLNQLVEFRSPEKYLSRNLSMLIDRARTMQQMPRLKKYVEQHRSLRSASPVPNVFDAYQLADVGKGNAAVSMLARLAAENPDLPEYWHSVATVRLRSALSLKGTDEIGSLMELAGFDQRVEYVRQAVSADLDNSAKLLSQFFDANPASLEPLELLHAILEAEELDSHSRRQLGAQLHGVLSDSLKKNGVNAVPLMEGILVASDREEQAAMLLFNALARTDSPPVIESLIHRMKTAEATSAFDSRTIGERIRSSELTFAGAGREIILAEIDALAGQPEAALERLRKQVELQPRNAAAVASLLRMSGYVLEYSPRVGELSLWLRKQYPNSPDTLIAVSCGLRCAERYSDAKRSAIDAFSLRQDPVYLLHAAYADWLADRTEKAAELLQLAKLVGLDENRLTVLDRRLLQSLETDPELTPRKRHENEIPVAGFRASGFENRIQANPATIAGM